MGGVLCPPDTVVSRRPPPRPVQLVVVDSQRGPGARADPGDEPLWLPAREVGAGPVDPEIVAHALPGHEDAILKLPEPGADGGSHPARALLRLPAAVVDVEVDAR